MLVMKSFVKSAVIPLLFTSSIGNAMDEPKLCLGEEVPVRGKIFNNAIDIGHTLGTVHMILETSPKTTKMKCGLYGTAYFLEDEDQDPNDPLSSLPRFTHKIVCDDKISDPEAGIHSQLIADTHFVDYTFIGCCDEYCSKQTFSFVESSNPQSGRGLFAAEGGGNITVEGSLNCSGAIDMTYDGNFCLE